MFRTRRVVLLEALVVTYSLTAAAFHSNPPSIMAEPVGLVRLAIPMTAAVLGLSVRNKIRERQPHSSAFDVVIAFGLAFLSQGFLSFLKPDLMLPRWAPTQGSFVGAALLVFCRSLFGSESVSAASESNAERKRDFEIFAKSLAACAVIGGGTAVLYILTGSLKQQAAGGLILAGSLYAACHAGYVLSQTRKEIDGQGPLRLGIPLLRSASGCCYWSVIPGTLILLAGSQVYLYWIPLVVVILAEIVHQRATRMLIAA